MNIQDLEDDMRWHIGDCLLQSKVWIQKALLEAPSSKKYENIRYNACLPDGFTYQLERILQAVDVLIKVTYGQRFEGRVVGDIGEIQWDRSK